MLQHVDIFLPEHVEALLLKRELPHSDVIFGSFLKLLSFITAVKSFSKEGCGWFTNVVYPTH